MRSLKIVNGVLLVLVWCVIALIAITLLITFLIGEKFYKGVRMEKRHRRRIPLTSGKCSLCGRKAQIPWKGKKYCYQCWDKKEEKWKDRTKFAQFVRKKCILPTVFYISAISTVCSERISALVKWNLFPRRLKMRKAVCPRCFRLKVLTKHHIKPLRHFGKNPYVIYLCKDCHRDIETVIKSEEFGIGELKDYEYFEITKLFIKGGVSEIYQ